MKEDQTEKDENLEELGEKLQALKAHDAIKEHKQAAQEKENESRDIGMRAGAELIGVPLTGALMGYWLDRGLDTAPIFLITLIFIGMTAAFWNIYKMMEKGE